ncbi:type II secretion system major pseudopilin GspG [Pseudobacteriovorax antillogorgiicola]|uniref:Type II secretion system protein G (GspG) n=2 Tax=Pseudobacteriovorax antillogorgiicola TaxID=1513793 RepID=A0A1Y6B7W3_9BACT|nr:type II secretion system major pseudopilin GspG [Pseudobacteriovorax antillogorgiicola]TCS58714.1 type II secretion system protein G (GspG) [Pseudobacteriovorax antillogorgiicola]SME95474.1 type II secretion system protein G (GspG) [Pseudobacteriovorax antillogorgiicola]
MTFKTIKNLMLRPFGDEERRSEIGMSIIEILIVIALMGTVMAILVTNLTGQQEEALKDAARLGMGQIETNLQLYKVHNFRYPTTEQGLRALVEKPSNAKRWRGPYMDANKMNDPWDNEYQYESDGRSFKIISPGIDGVVGSEDDIVYPEEAGGDTGEG